jgi:prevent-host-death family protein
LKVTASKLRENIYKILDEVLATGMPVEVVRHGKTLKIVPEDEMPKTRRRKTPNKLMVGDPESFVHVEWLHEWSEMK